MKFANIVILFLITVTIVFVLKGNSTKSELSQTSGHFWTLQSIDTVKYSRDPAREFARNSNFDKTIDAQVKSIASTGATHIAIGTPYDKEFVPFLKRWVVSARKYDLNVWFRGNFSGWEHWFNYPAITRAQHEELLKKFIVDNGDLFKDGDIFTACTECENGGPGDPRQNGDASGHRQFLIDEYQIGKTAFRQIGKDVATNYFPMNADVAKLIMDKPTTQALGGLMVIDHYVSSYNQMDSDINSLAESSGGKVVIGEFGAPIPDLHGNMTENEQADWIDTAFAKLSANPNVIGVNYWTSFGGSTQLWNDNGQARNAVKTITDYYTPITIKGYVKNQIGSPIANVELITNGHTITTNSFGQFYLPYTGKTPSVKITANGYMSVIMANWPNNGPITIVLQKHKESVLFKLQKEIFKILKI